MEIIIVWLNSVVNTFFRPVFLWLFPQFSLKSDEKLAYIGITSSQAALLLLYCIRNTRNATPQSGGDYMDQNRKNTPNEDAIGEIISWVITFILLFAVWPVGIFMLLRKLRGYAKTAGRADAHAVVSAEKQPSKKTQKNIQKTLARKSGRFISFILLVISIILFAIGVNMISGAVRDIFGNGLTRWSDLFFGLFYFVGGLISFFSRNVMANRFSRYKRYYAFVDERGIVSIPEISRGVGYAYKTVIRDLQAMINAGYFGPNAYLDSELDSLVLFAEAAMEVRRSKKAQQTTPQTAQKPEKPDNQYMAIIIELRELNDTIADIPISDKIDRIEVLTAKIFRIVEDNPSKLPQIRRFMNYYLPTTLKLLHSYATLEKQDIHGENITAAKENIGRILETLATGFEQQLDQLFQSDVMDIAADINVLENMMQQDGLTGEKTELSVMSSGAAAGTTATLGM